MNSILAWLLPMQPSTVIGLGVAGGTIAYYFTGDPIWAGIAAAAIKILVPDNTVGSSNVLTAIGTLAKALGKPLPK